MSNQNNKNHQVVNQPGVGETISTTFGVFTLVAAAFALAAGILTGYKRNKETDLGEAGAALEDYLASQDQVIANLRSEVDSLRRAKANMAAAMYRRAEGLDIEDQVNDVLRETPDTGGKAKPKAADKV